MQCANGIQPARCSHPARSCSSRPTYYRFKSVTGREADETALPFEDGSFDAAAMHMARSPRHLGRQGHP
ncbi:hypothetical protein E5S70_16920 [Ensifer adhaerens]|nr:hypothetical protein [Ensifer canadensis]